EDPRLEAERGRAYQDLGALRRELGDHARALDELAAAETIFQHLTRTIPDEPAYAHELAWTWLHRGAVLRELSRFDQGEQAYRQALNILEPLGPKSRAAVAQATNRLGELLIDVGRRDEAEAPLRRAIRLWKGLLEEQTDSLEARARLAQAWVTLGNLLHA